MDNTPFVKVFDQYSIGFELGHQYILVMMHSETKNLCCWYIFNSNSEPVLNGEQYNPVDALEQAKHEMEAYDREKCITAYKQYQEKR